MARHDIEENCGAAGIEGATHSTYEGMHAGGPFDKSLRQGVYECKCQSQSNAGNNEAGVNKKRGFFKMNPNLMKDGRLHDRSKGHDRRNRNAFNRTWGQVVTYAA